MVKGYGTAASYPELEFGTYLSYLQRIEGIMSKLLITSAISLKLSQPWEPPVSIELTKTNGRLLREHWGLQITRSEAERLDVNHTNPNSKLIF
jgi:hypothetical protein